MSRACNAVQPTHTRGGAVSESPRFHLSARAFLSVSGGVWFGETGWLVITAVYGDGGGKAKKQRPIGVDTMRCDDYCTVRFTSVVRVVVSSRAEQSSEIMPVRQSVIHKRRKRPPIARTAVSYPAEDDRG